MDRIRGQGPGQPARLWAQPPLPFALPSRVAALNAATAVLEDQPGLFLISGDAGVGKTWLWRQLRSQARSFRHWAHLDATPVLDPAGLHEAIARALGLIDGAAPAGGPRWAVLNWLEERAVQGERAVLVLDEAHNAQPAVLEEIRVLANAATEAAGFAAICLVGQTPLSRRINTGPLAALRSRLVERVHLRPLDLEESGLLLESCDASRAWDPGQVELLHREVGGNPSALLRLAARVAPREEAPRPTIAAPTLPVARTVRIDPAPPSVLPERPPLLVGDGIVEVGWEPSPADPVGVRADRGKDGPLMGAEPAAAEDDSIDVTAAPELSTPLGEEAIHDHYAAIQAWNEWSEASTDERRGHEAAALGALEGAPRHDVGSGGQVWADGQQPFAPYSQLFTRLKRASDVE